VDIIEWSNVQNPKILVDNNGLIKLHTVLFYKLKIKNIVVLDPSNYYFSGHLSLFKTKSFKIITFKNK